eukprot:746999-Hanusia_phi.AAC.3
MLLVLTSRVPCRVFSSDAIRRDHGCLRCCRALQAARHSSSLSAETVSCFRDDLPTELRATRGVSVLQMAIDDYNLSKTMEQREIDRMELNAM